ncbi:uncharacterized [Tachysurus ichikawai]
MGSATGPGSILWDDFSSGVESAWQDALSGQRSFLSRLQVSLRRCGEYMTNGTKPLLQGHPIRLRGAELSTEACSDLSSEEKLAITHRS